MRAADETTKPSAATNLGLGVTLYTNGYSFSRDVLRSERQTTPFVATIAVTNRSRAPIPFAFHLSLPEARFAFKIFNADGEKVWSSKFANAGVNGAPWPATLGRGQTWRSVVRIPLREIFLPVGSYTLEATLDTDQAVGASSAFEIVSAEPPRPATIAGVIWNSLFQTQTPNYVGTYQPIANAQVEVRQISLDGSVKSPFLWTGSADADGKFSVQVPAGFYQVKALQQAGGGPMVLSALQDGLEQIKLSPGKFSRPVLMVGTAVQGAESVDSVRKLSIQEVPGDSSRLLIVVEGSVPTGGYSQPQLVSREMTKDGWLEFEYVAQTPTGVASEAFMTIHTQANIPKLPNLVGVRVHARRGTREATVP